MQEPGCWGCASVLAGSIDTGISLLFLQARKNARSYWLWEVGGRFGGCLLGMLLFGRGYEEILIGGWRGRVRGLVSKTEGVR